MTDQASVSLLRWLRRQLREPTPWREHLEAAVANDDPVEARRLLARMDFTEAQRHHVAGSDRPLGGGPLSLVEENTALVRRIMEAFANKEGFALRECFAEDAVWHVPGGGVMSGTYRGRTEIFRFLARLPKLTDGTYRSTFLDALASEERGAGLYRARGEREGRTIDIDQLLLFTIRDGLVTEVLALPSDPAAFERFGRRRASGVRSCFAASGHGRTRSRPDPGRCARRYDSSIGSGSGTASRNSTSSRWIREPSISITRSASPSIGTSSPTSGARPSAPKTMPAIVW